MILDILHWIRGQPGFASLVVSYPPLYVFVYLFAGSLLTNNNFLQGFGMPLAGYLIHWIGARPAIAAGCLIFSSGTALTYFTLNMVSWSHLLYPQHGKILYHVLLCSYIT